jgi:hypothetical protein
MIILSRKPGEAIVLGPPAVLTVCGVVPSPPLSGDSGPSGRGGGSPPVCATFVATPRPKIEDAAHPGPIRRRRPTLQDR